MNIRTQWLADRVHRVIGRRMPDVVIGGHDDPYLLRWHLIPRNRWFNVYAHVFCRSDDDRALHDHPWHNLSILLEGIYLEHTDHGVVERSAGAVVFRRPTAAHRIELLYDPNAARDEPVVTLFLTGPRLRDWGFWCPQGWRHFREFTDPGTDGTTTGKGCA